MTTGLAVERRDPPPLPLLAAAGVLLAAAAAVTAWLRGHHQPTDLTAVALAASVSYLVCGLLLWRLRPWSRVGPVLLLTAPAWLITQYQGPEVDSTVRYLANWFAGAPVLLLAHLVLSYPTGRLQTWPRRLFIAVGATVVIPFGFLFNTEYGPRLALFGQALTFLAAGMALGRWAGARGPLRRLLTPLPVVAVLFAATALPNALMLLQLASPTQVADAALVAAAVQPLVPIAFLLGLVSTRRARGGVADLVVELEAGRSPADVRDLLARALRDPSLQLGYWVPDRHSFVDHQGLAMDLPDTDDVRVCVGIEDDGQPLAVVVHDRALGEERELVEAVLAAVRLALANERLQALARAQLVEVRASRARIVEAADAARSRLERDLHDGAQQRLLALGMRLQLAGAYADGPADALRLELERAQAELEQALTELRELARGLHPTRLREDGLAAALHDLSTRTPLPMTLSCTDRRFDELVESTAYFVVTEALTNAVKHAAASTVGVQVMEQEGELQVEVLDDGLGGATVRPGGGLGGLVDRLSAVDGDLVLRSLPGHGTRLTARVPLAARAPQQAPERQNAEPLIAPAAAG